MDSSRTAQSVTKMWDTASQKKYSIVRRAIEEVFRQWGFEMITTPIMADISTLQAKFVGDEIGQQILKVGETNMALRFDQTVLLGEYIGQNLNQISFPLKRYSIGTSFRREFKGRLWEFDQADCDIITEDGSSGISEIEVLSVLSDILEKLGLDFQIKINDLDILKGILDYLLIPQTMWNPILRVLDKMAKVNANKIIEFLSEIGIELDKAEELVSFFTLGEEAIEVLKKMPSKNVYLEEGLNRTIKLQESISSVGLKNVKFDLSIIRGLNYYSGLVFEAFLDGKQAIAGGGVYKNLENLTGNPRLSKFNGIGFGIGLTRLVSLMADPPKEDSPILIIPILSDGPACMIKAFELASKLRSVGLKVRIYTEADKLKKSFRYADREGFAKVVVIGGREVEENTYTLKYMGERDKKQLSLTLENLLGELQ
jgi:histidyl-tRNA synthetase